MPGLDLNPSELRRIRTSDWIPIKSIAKVTGLIFTGKNGPRIPLPLLVCWQSSQLHTAGAGNQGLHTALSHRNTITPALVSVHPPASGLGNAQFILSHWSLGRISFAEKKGADPGR